MTIPPTNTHTISSEVTDEMVEPTKELLPFFGKITLPDNLHIQEVVNNREVPSLLQYWKCGLHLAVGLGPMQGLTNQQGVAYSSNDAGDGPLPRTQQLKWDGSPQTIYVPHIIANDKYEPQLLKTNTYTPETKAWQEDTTTYIPKIFRKSRYLPQFMRDEGTFLHNTLREWGWDWYVVPKTTPQRKMVIRTKWIAQRQTTTFRKVTEWTKTGMEITTQKITVMHHRKDKIISRSTILQNRKQKKAKIYSTWQAIKAAKHIEEAQWGLDTTPTEKMTTRPKEPQTTQIMNTITGGGSPDKPNIKNNTGGFIFRWLRGTEAHLYLEQQSLGVTIPVTGIDMLPNGETAQKGLEDFLDNVKTGMLSADTHQNLAMISTGNHWVLWVKESATKARIVDPYTSPISSVQALITKLKQEGWNIEYQIKIQNNNQQRTQTHVDTE